MNATKQQETETNLNQLMQKYQQAYQDNQQELAKQQQEKMAPIMNKITTAIKNVGKNGGYVYIMDVSAGIPYISDTLSKDVTADVKAEVNKIK
jgi:outer membrane protein